MRRKKLAEQIKKNFSREDDYFYSVRGRDFDRIYISYDCGTLYSYNFMTREMKKVSDKKAENVMGIF